ncbi:MAG: DUF6267 family protein [Pseudomonadota bacterium]
MDRFYPSDDEKKAPLHAMFSSLVANLLPAMSKISSSDKDVIFQGDLLYSLDEDRAIEDGVISFQPNAISYRVAKTHEMYKPIEKSQVGIVFHTAGIAGLDSDGKLRITGSASEEALQGFVSELESSDEVFAITPKHVEPTVAIESLDEGLIEKALQEIRGQVSDFTPEFRDAYSKHVSSSLKVFLNSGLHPGAPQGLYELVHRGLWGPDSARGVLVDYQNWFLSKVDMQSQSKSYSAKKFEQLNYVIENHYGLMLNLLNAYASALNLQWQMMRALPVHSRLGGGAVEGFMRETNGSIVKVVDRIGFTILNNQVNLRNSSGLKPFDLGETEIEFAHLPHPLRRWRPEALFVIMKGQPIHAGHIALIKEARKSGRPVFVLASNKAPNFQAEKWNDFDATETKGDLYEGKYKYFLDNAIRRQLLAAGLGHDPGISIHVMSPRWFLDAYLSAAKGEGQEKPVSLVVGAKELDDNRFEMVMEEFPDHFRLEPVELLEGGVSATDIRESIRLGNEEALSSTLDYISDQELKALLMSEILLSWQRVAEVAEGFKAAEEEARAARAKEKEAMENEQIQKISDWLALSEEDRLAVVDDEKSYTGLVFSTSEDVFDGAQSIPVREFLSLEQVEGNRSLTKQLSKIQELVDQIDVGVELEDNTVRVGPPKIELEIVSIRKNKEVVGILAKISQSGGELYDEDNEDEETSFASEEAAVAAGVDIGADVKWSLRVQLVRDDAGEWVMHTDQYSLEWSGW